MDAIFRLLYYSEQFPKNTAMNHTMLTLCHHLDEVADLSIDEIAALCNTNPMMLSRIARKTGYKNFSAFRVAVQEAVQQSRYINRNIPMDRVRSTDPSGSFLDYMAEMVETLRAPWVQHQIDAVCAALHAAGRVHFYGPPNFSIYMVMLLHDLISDGKEVHPYTSRESITADMDTIGADSLVLVVPNDLAVDDAFTREILEAVEARGGQLVLHTAAGDALLGFTRGPNLIYPHDHTAASNMASAFMLNMLSMTYRNTFLDSRFP